jgi:ATP-dependent protease ClpP protease subunit
MNNNPENNIENPLQIPFFPTRDKDQIRSFKRTIPLSIYDFYIVDDIQEPDKYLELIQTLKGADPQDTVFIYLNTNGGNLYTTVQIMAAMTSSNAKVITCIEGQVCSAGTFIFLKGDTKIVNPHCTFMIHNYSQSTSGKGHEIINQINYMEGYFDGLAADIYGDFLTEKEINNIINGDDLWMGSHEVVERLAANKHDYIYTGYDLEAELTAPTPPVKKATKKKTTKKKATKK